MCLMFPPLWLENTDQEVKINLKLVPGTESGLIECHKFS